jgi:hypothetical protein
MTPAQIKFVELERKKEAVKKYFEELQAATEEAIKEIGINGLFQDEEKIVYKLVVPEGRFVKFEKVGYERTKRPGERAGTLSMKEAKEAGFNID